MRALSSAHCTDVRLYTLRIKIGTRTTRARVVELAFGLKTFIPIQAKAFINEQSLFMVAILMTS